MRGCAAARVRAAQALRNIVTSNPDSRRSRREERVLQLLEQIRAYCDTVAADSDTDDVEQQDHDMAGVHQGSLWLISVNQSVRGVQNPMKMSGIISFYRAMHFSAKRGIAIVCYLSVRLSVCLSVTIRYRDHIGWNSSKIISRPNSLGPV